jgi:hypothetical protein
MSQQLEREAIRDQLSMCRAQQDSVEEDDLEQVERGEREMMVSLLASKSHELFDILEHHNMDELKRLLDHSKI